MVSIQERVIMAYARYLALFSSAFYNSNLNLFIIKVRRDIRIINKLGMEFGRKQKKTIHGALSVLVFIIQCK